MYPFWRFRLGKVEADIYFSNILATISALPYPIRHYSLPASSNGSEREPKGTTFKPSKERKGTCIVSSLE
jgi:hypothetical protein